MDLYPLGQACSLISVIEQPSNSDGRNSLRWCETCDMRIYAFPCLVLRQSHARLMIPLAKTYLGNGAVTKLLEV